ncbi:hypothetical protein N431DRAFT_501113 [Stipitochalara longipes BDJ]|nr:hypothetical protein N431DRAFT_501113 [Stipitochalara longipes BDJ]
MPGEHHQLPHPVDSGRKSVDSVYDLTKPCHGWPELANVICKQPGFEAFPSYKDLHIKSLLYYQAELDGIRRELHEQEWIDHRLNPFEDAYTLSSRADTLLLCDGETGDKGAQIDKVKRMRIVLKEYSDALLQYSKINELPPADPVNVNTLHNFLRKPIARHIEGDGSDSWGKLKDPLPPRKTPGRQFIHLLRSLSIFWPEEPEKCVPGLVVPGNRRDVSGLTRWVKTEWVPFWHSVRMYFIDANAASEPAIRQDPEKQPADKEPEIRRLSSASFSPTLIRKISGPFIRRMSSSETSPGEEIEDTPDNADKVLSKLDAYSIGRIQTFTSFVTTIIACLLPTAAIAILATIHSTAEVLGFIGLFTALFAAGLMFLTDKATSRTEIFTATAAFSAVLVVFVQNQNGAPGGSNNGG